MTGLENLLDIKQAAKFLNVSEASLRRWTNDGRLTCLRLGKKKVRRFRVNDLLAFLLEQKAEIKPSNSVMEPTAPPGQRPAQAKTAHMCSLCTNEYAMAKIAIDFISEGLDDNSSCFFLAHHDASDEIRNRLKVKRPDFQKDVASGRLQFLDFMDSVNAQIIKLDRLFSQCVHYGAKNINVVQNISKRSMSAKSSFDHIIKYEIAYETNLSKKYPLTTLCQYDLRSFNGLEIAEILKCHPDNFRHPVDSLIL